MGRAECAAEKWTGNEFVIFTIGLLQSSLSIYDSAILGDRMGYLEWGNKIMRIKEMFNRERSSIR